jgi:hypothetical protein
MNRPSVVVGASVLALLFGALTLLGAIPSPQEERPTAPGLGTAGREDSGGAPFEPALFAARVRIACPSFVDVDEVVLGSA